MCAAHSSNSGIRSAWWVSRRKLERIAIALLAVAVLAGCAAQARLAAPPEFANSAHVVGIETSTVRFWGDAPLKNIASAERTLEDQARAAHRTGSKRSHAALVISGGGSNGAFGAGLLAGWSQTGKRPEFDVVTGVSTGALMAPFAFLGPRYDHVLKTFYTSYSTRDILKPTVLSGLFGGSAVASSQPLADLIAQYMTKDVMREIAREHRRGRRLLIGTTNLDAERPVTWNIGGIAVIGTDRALNLIRHVLLASASIPGVFPPVMMNVRVNGKVAQEMHVDGGTTDNAILLPIQTNLSQIDHDPSWQKRQMFIIVNSRLDPEWKSVKPRIIDIASRSIDTLIKQQTLGDVLKLYNFSRKNHIGFRLATVPSDFNRKAKEAFDKKYMAALFQRGFELGRKGYHWMREPPVR
jgi:predicted patatin/cPLA2 family phospholipase